MLGTRPEIIKMSPIIRECERLGLDFFILHTGQHYSYQLDGVFFEQLKLPKPKYNLGVGSGTYAEELSGMLVGIERVLKEEKPSIALVYGDTNSCFAGALTSVQCHIPVGHIEAGLRSYDRAMPEEINRILVDHCSDYLFAPTEKSETILWREGISDVRVFMVGNTIVDAVMQNAILGYASEQVNYIGKYILATIHRQENVDNRERFTFILRGLERVSEEFDMPVFYPMHPRARKMMTEFGLWGIIDKRVQINEPCDYLKFLWMEKYASLILTDSGGVQEEACILGVPCVTLRDNTERPETIEVGANVLAGVLPDRIVECVKVMVDKNNSWANPFGDGKAAQRIIEIVRRICG